MKKLLSLTLAAVFMLSLLPTVLAAPNLNTASTWARGGITSAVNKGFVPAEIQGNYTNIITRAEFCRMAVRWVEYATSKNIDTILSERGLSRNPNPFTDTSDLSILAAYALGITSGTSATTFTPNGQFTRQQAATMLMNTARAIGANITNPPASGFADMSQAATWAHPGINFVRANGIMSGTGGNNFSPLTNFTREQSIITFDNIVVNNLPGIGATPPPQAQSLVGTWLWLGTTYYVFEANGRGTMIGMDIRWWTSAGILSICSTPDFCGNNCFAPTEWRYSISGNTLTLTSDILDMSYTYTRR
jgi:hypothetical protein